MDHDPGAAFLITELDTGLTFAGIAAQAQSDEGKAKRNRRNARKAYDTVLHFLATSVLTSAEDTLVRRKREQLRKALVLLGEVLD